MFVTSVKNARGLGAVRRRAARPTTVAAIAALLATIVIGSLADSPARAATRCPDFTILHDDRIGKLQLPAGRYSVTVISGLACEDTTRLLREWLQRENVTSGWKVDARTATFARRSRAFRISKDNGGGAGHPGRTVCPGSFRVLHNDRIGALRIPAGDYRITTRRMTCPKASDKFTRFLDHPSGELPGNWEVRPIKAKFRNSRSGESFRIKPAGGR